MLQDVLLDRLVIGIPRNQPLFSLIVLANTDVDNPATSIQEPHYSLKQYLIEQFVVWVCITLVLLSDSLRLVDDLILVEVWPATKVVLTDSRVIDLL